MSSAYHGVDPREGSIDGARAWFAAHGLFRVRKGRMIAGVCAGLAERYDVNPLVVRLAAIASLLLPGPQVLAYIGLWILMPREPVAG
jgi:phage shock protein PspC (stress-responsive transcriptional regulator)